MKDLSAHFHWNEEKLRIIAREKRMQVFQLRLEEHSAASRIMAENQEFERDATARFQQKTLCRYTTHARSIPSSTSFQDDECDRHTSQMTFRFCASCIEDVQKRTRAAVEFSSAHRNTPTCLLQGLSFTGTTDIIYHGVTCVPWKMLVLALL